MAYVNDDQSIQRHADVLKKLNEAFVRGNGDLKLILTDGRSPQGRYYGTQCTANATSKICCTAALGGEEGEYPGIYDVLDIVCVEAVKG